MADERAVAVSWDGIVGGCPTLHCTALQLICASNLLCWSVCVFQISLHLLVGMFGKSVRFHAVYWSLLELITGTVWSEFLLHKESHLETWCAPHMTTPYRNCHEVVMSTRVRVHVIGPFALLLPAFQWSHLKASFLLQERAQLVCCAYLLLWYEIELHTWAGYVEVCCKFAMWAVKGHIDFVTLEGVFEWVERASIPASCARRKWSCRGWGADGLLALSAARDQRTGVSHVPRWIPFL